MRDLEKHIARLLLDNDCVIVPGFGGFMAHSIPAKYDEDTCLFTPPIRIVGFNPQLTMNDSLLAQEYVNTYDISFPEALKQIATDVESLKRRIDEERIYELLGIGKFIINDDSSLKFVPEETGVITPALYGLDAITVKPMEKGVKEAGYNIERSNRQYRRQGNGIVRDAVRRDSSALHKAYSSSMHRHRIHAHDACQVGRFEQAEYQPKRN